MLINSRMLIDNLYTRMSMSSTANYGDPSTYHICTYIQTYTLQQQKYALVYATIIVFYYYYTAAAAAHSRYVLYIHTYVYVRVNYFIAKSDPNNVNAHSNNCKQDKKTSTSKTIY